jgi:formylglycine-generating enzyme required for sulfatase activity
MCFGLVAVLSTPAGAVIITECPPDAVLVGQTCVDKYEASVWSFVGSVPSGGGELALEKILKGTVTLTDLEDERVTQISPSSLCEPPFPSTFPPNGGWTEPLYAVSVPGVQPTACVTWFQAAQACRLSGKRLATNLEWQDAAAGTPDTGADDGTTDCNTSSTFDASLTGSRANCKSKWGAFDMVGNVQEWVAEWVPASTSCPGWPFSLNLMCLSGADSQSPGPGALLRGGRFIDGAVSGVFDVDGLAPPYVTSFATGFRCAR